MPIYGNVLPTDIRWVKAGWRNVSIYFDVLMLVNLLVGNRMPSP
jgi:hypothetical protein